MKSAGENRWLRVVGGLIIAYSIFNFYWPPMHLRGSAPSLTDTLHIVWASVTLVLMMLLMGLGAAGLGKRFRLYTIATFAVFLVCGVLTWLEAPGIAANLPSPTIGIWERINIGAFMLWVVVLAGALIQKEYALETIRR